MTIPIRAAFTCLAAATSLLATSLASAAETPPAALQGKSVKVRWAEEWAQKPAGAKNEFKTYVEQTWIVYVSTQGRVFQRRTIVQDRKPMRTFSVERVGNDVSGGRVSTFGAPDFATNTFTASRQTSTASTTKVTVTLDDKQETCAGAVAHDRGTEPAIFTGPATGKKFEIVAIKIILQPECEVVQKNLLGEEAG